MMVELGFDYDPSTAGSSVRFDPPNKADPVSRIQSNRVSPLTPPLRLFSIADHRS